MTRKKAKARLGSMPLSPPRVSDSPEQMADWVEYWSLVNGDGNTSFSELLTAMKIGGSADAYSELDAFDFAEVDGAAATQEETEAIDLYEAAAEATFNEISDRMDACGDMNYPFDVSSERISIREDNQNSTYTFLLLLSKYGPDAGPKKNEGAKLFEDVCANAVTLFLGGRENLADAEVFGFPRRVDHDGFADALDRLCQRMAEGEGNRERPTTPDQKDAKLDVVGWKSFRDKRKGRLIIFGQCATGDNWREKRFELIPISDWCGLWMKDRPAVMPIRAFFVPHRVSGRDWFETCVHGGLFFDRCRLVSYASSLPESIKEEIVKWSNHVRDRTRN